MNCRTTRRLLPLHSGRDLPARRAAAVESHLADCAECRREMESWDALRERLRAARPPAVAPSGVWERIEPRLAAIDAAARLRRPWHRRPIVWLGGAAAAILAVAFLVQGGFTPADPSPVPGAGATLAAGAAGGTPTDGLIRVPAAQLDEFLHVQAALVRPAEPARPFVRVVPVGHRVDEF